MEPEFAVLRFLWRNSANPDRSLLYATTVFSDNPRSPARCSKNAMMWRSMFGIVENRRLTEGELTVHLACAVEYGLARLQTLRK